MIWIEDSGFIREKINSIFFQTVQREEAGQISGKKDTVMTGNRFIELCEKFRIIETGKNNIFEAGSQFSFRTEQQPVFNKNFELLSEKLLSNAS